MTSCWKLLGSFLNIVFNSGTPSCLMAKTKKGKRFGFKADKIVSKPWVKQSPTNVATMNSPTWLNRRRNPTWVSKRPRLNKSKNSFKRDASKIIMRLVSKWANVWNTKSVMTKKQLMSLWARILTMMFQLTLKIQLTQLNLMIQLILLNHSILVSAPPVAQIVYGAINMWPQLKIKEAAVHAGPSAVFLFWSRHMQSSITTCSHSPSSSSLTATPKAKVVLVVTCIICLCLHKTRLCLSIQTILTWQLRDNAKT